VIFFKIFLYLEKRTTYKVSASSAVKCESQYILQVILQVQFFFFFLKVISNFINQMVTNTCSADTQSAI